MATKKRPAEPSATHSAKKGKAEPVTPAITVTLSRLPRALPPACTGNPEVDAKGDVVGMLTLDALDLGDVRWNEAEMKALPGRERRVYQAASDAAFSAQNARHGWLVAVMNAAARTVPGRARLCEIVQTTEAAPLARQLAAEALVATRPSHDPGELRPVARDG